MRMCVLLFVAALGCALDSSGPSDREYWDAYPWSVVRIEGPSPTIAAFLAPASDMPGLQRSVIVVTNPGPDSLRLFFGPCDFGLRLYQNASLQGAPVWDNRVGSCDAVLHWLDVPPNETRSLPVWGFLNAVDLSGELRPGRYFVAVTWRSPTRRTVQVVPAGEWRLEVAH